VFNTVRQLGGSFGIAILAVVFATVGSYASPEAFSVGFAPAMAGAAVMSVLGAIAGLWTPRRRRASEPGTPAPGAAVPVQQARS
jgi:lipopolysaccharide export LptBFGC system permease protein LptF